MLNTYVQGFISVIDWDPYTDTDSEKRLIKNTPIANPVSVQPYI